LSLNEIESKKTEKPARFDTIFSVGRDCVEALK